jgi:UPF0042 nucleotide-binding protein
MKLLLLAGQSGAGLSTALGALEDLGYCAVRGLPAAMLADFAAFCENTGKTQAAAACRIQDKDELSRMLDAVKQLRQQGKDCRIVFLEAEQQVLINRYKFTRRPHPLSGAGVTTMQAIVRERDLLARLRTAAEYTIDTSHLRTLELRKTMIRIATETRDHILSVSVVSFGFKYGIPADADLVLDVRFLPNPYYIPELRPKNGMDAPVRDYVFHDGTAEEYMEKLCGMVDFLLPQYQREGKAVLTIAVGCTGGHHRSVAIAQTLLEYLQDRGISADAVHRDLKKG